MTCLSVFNVLDSPDLAAESASEMERLLAYDSPMVNSILSRDTHFCPSFVAVGHQSVSS